MFTRHNCHREGKLQFSGSNGISVSRRITPHKCRSPPQQSTFLSCLPPLQLSETRLHGERHKNISLFMRNPRRNYFSHSRFSQMACIMAAGIEIRSLRQRYRTSCLFRALPRLYLVMHALRAHRTLVYIVLTSAVHDLHQHTQARFQNAFLTFI